jgi:hypothetical protein
MCCDFAQGIINVAAVDCDVAEHKNLCGRFGVQGFPTIKVGTIEGLSFGPYGNSFREVRLSCSCLCAVVPI